MLAIFLIIIIFLIILSSESFAFQVSPAKITQTEQNQTHEFLVRVNNPGMVEISFEGTLAQYAKANASYIESEARIPVTVDLPELTPGKHELFVIFEKTISSGEVGARAQIGPKITYVEEFEGVYIETTATIRQNTQPLEIVTIHENFGTTPGTTEVLLQLEDILIQEEVFVEDITRKDYTIEHTKGEYELTTTLSNGTETATTKQAVEIGNPEMTLENLSATMGDIAVLDLQFSSDWNVPHEEQLKVRINGDELESVTMTVPGTAQVFWESPEEGNATVTFTIGEQEITREVVFEEEQFLPETNTLLLVLLIMAVLIGVALLFKNKETFK